MIVPEAIRFVPSPQGTLFENPIWLRSSGEVVVALVLVGGHVWEQQLYSLRPDGGDLRRLPLPDDPQCKNTSHLAARELPDGRVAYVQRCWGSLTEARHLPRETASLMVYDPTDGAVSRLVPYYLPVNASYFDFAPDMHVGIIYDGRGLAERLWWLWPDRIEELDLPFERAGRPSWSPDGRTIAVDAAPFGAAVRGVARLDLPRKLYLMTADGAEFYPIVEGLTNAGETAWSPDSRWLVFSLYFADGRQGLWLIEAATGRRYRLDAGQRVVGSAMWSPDGGSLLAHAGVNADYPDGVPGGEVGFYIIDLPDLDRYLTPESS